jgi:toxin YoeB
LSKSKSRNAVLVVEFLEDLEYWIKTDRRLALKVLSLIEATVRDPFDGPGKPEPLKHFDPDTWSRRINQEHRIVYRVKDQQIDFLHARYHY